MRKIISSPYHKFQRNEVKHKWNLIELNFQKTNHLVRNKLRYPCIHLHKHGAMLWLNIQLWIENLLVPSERTFLMWFVLLNIHTSLLNPNLSSTILVFDKYGLKMDLCLFYWNIHFYFIETTMFEIKVSLEILNWLLIKITIVDL